MSRVLPLAVALACLCGSGLAWPQVAPADHGPALSDPVIDRYLEVAARHWGVAAPVCSGPSGEPVPVHATLWDDPDPDVVAAAEQPGCRIWLDRDHWPRRSSKPACVVIVHEWGHLLGFGHSPNPDDVMFSAPMGGAPACAMAATPRPEMISIGTAVRARSKQGARRSRPRPRRARGSAVRKRRDRATAGVRLRRPRGGSGVVVDRR